MALVLFANTKGGSGKTTAALVLAGELVNHRGKVVILEGDPNRPLMNWAKARDMAVLETSRSRIKSPVEAAELIEKAATAEPGAGRLAVVHDDDQEGVFDWIEGAASWAHFVIADPEGSPNEWLTDVASQADLVIIPFAPSALDAKQVSRTVQVLQRVAKRSGKPVNYRILLTRAGPGAVMTRDEREIRQSLEKNGLPLMKTTLCERPAYRGLFKLDATIGELPETAINGLDSARRNAAEFVAEVIAILKNPSAQQTRAA
ncbi:MAG TPA: ParA family protein [Caulobacteraceae bacterium]|nr:ParA family protein [Caulobacteraceae bacterium]